MPTGSGGLGLSAWILHSFAYRPATEESVPSGTAAALL